MASKVIKGLTVEIGGDTTKLGKALDGLETKSRNLSKELGEVNRLLKLDPGNTELLAQKQQILAEAVENTKEKLNTLKEAEAQVQAQFERGEVSAEQVRALKREIEATEQKLRSYERAVDETANEVNRLGTGADDAAHEIDDMADAADDAKDSSNELGSSLDGTLAKGFTVVAAAAAAASAAIVGCVEASHEYRTAMGKLETAFTTNGHSAETAYNTYADLQSILGETDQATEAANHLAVLVDNEKDLQKWTDICTGVFADYGDSLPIEGLTEAANHTAKLGEVQGPLADALEWSGISAEDFNEALADCNDEQERQKLITETLIDLYGDAADAYKDVNKEVIESNKANEKWNKTVADIGETMAPAVTEIKNFGAEVLGELKEPLKDVAGFIRTTVLPALAGIINWVKANGPAIKAVLVGITAAIVAYKVATIATEVAQVGLKGAILATAAAEKVLQAVQAASPWGLVAVAIAAVTTALIAYAAATQQAKPKIDFLTEAQRQQIQASKDAAAAWRDQVAATTESEGKIQSQMGYIQNLRGELDKLVDANGRVKDSDKARVDFIIGQLNDALGTEYNRVGDVIQQYDNLKASVDNVIASKTAELLLDANKQDYVDALQNMAGAEEAYYAARDDWQKTVNSQSERELELQAAINEENEKWDAIVEARAANSANAQVHADIINRLYDELGVLVETREGKKAALDQAQADYENYSKKIAEYASAETAILQGEYEVAKDILTGKTSAQEGYAAVLESSVQKNLDVLADEAAKAGEKAEETKKNFEAGVEGFTQEMVNEAQKGYAEALKAYEDAYVDAHGIGDDVGKGLAVGLEDERDALRKKARSIVNEMIKEMRKTADSHSPARKLIDFGEDMGEGTEIGLENKTKDLLGTAKKQVNTLMGVYSNAGDEMRQTAFTNVSRSSVQRETKAYQSALSGNADRLDKILAAILAGQVIVLNGDAVVGGTAGRMDAVLGDRRILAERGAL